MLQIVFLMAEHYSITHHIFFTQSLVRGHLGSFHVLATMNNAAMNIVVPIALCVLSEFWGRCLEKGYTSEYIEISNLWDF